jgi:hypothetical protein
VTPSFQVSGKRCRMPHPFFSGFAHNKVEKWCHGVTDQGGNQTDRPPKEAA